MHAFSSLPVSDVNSATPQQRAFFHCTRSFSFAYAFFNRVDEFVQYLWAYVPDGTLALCQQIQGILMHFYSALSSMVLRSEEVLYAWIIHSAAQLTHVLHSLQTCILPLIIIVIIMAFPEVLVESMRLFIVFMSIKCFVFTDKCALLRYYRFYSDWYNIHLWIKSSAICIHVKWSTDNKFDWHW